MSDKVRNINTIPILDRSVALNYDVTMSPEEKVNYLVQNLRLTIDSHKHLHDITASKSIDYRKYPFKKNEYDIKQDNLLGEGAAVVDLLRRINWGKDDISFEKYDIKHLGDFYPDGEDGVKNRLNRNTHSISIVAIGDKKYIVDCTYRQFFLSQDRKKNQNSEHIDLSELCINNEQRKTLAEQILRYGWIEATPENVKQYMDMFIEATIGNENINFPTEEDYAKNFRGEIISGDIPERKVTEGCTINKGLRQYYINKSKNEEDKDKKILYQKIRNSLAFQNRGFSIIAKNGKQYIKGNIGSFDFYEDPNMDPELKQKIYTVLKKVQNGEIEFTEQSLKLYIDAYLILVSGDKNVERPTLEEYKEILGLDSLKKFGTVADTYIIDSEPYIMDNFDKNQFNQEMTAEEKLTSIVQEERQFLMQSRNVMTESLIGDCEDSTARVSLSCASKGLADTHYLFPGFYLENGVKGHNCTITTVDGKNYLIDCTYRQFFTKTNENSNPRDIYDS